MQGDQKGQSLVTSEKQRPSEENKSHLQELTKGTLRWSGTYHASGVLVMSRGPIVPGLLPLKPVQGRSW
ncbi:hypothetical protein BDV09DRAFT_162608 [Aspergillus tetrazonus]